MWKSDSNLTYLIKFSILFWVDNDKNVYLNSYPWCGKKLTKEFKFFQIFNPPTPGHRTNGQIHVKFKFSSQKKSESSNLDMTKISDQLSACTDMVDTCNTWAACILYVDLPVGIRPLFILSDKKANPSEKICGQPSGISIVSVWPVASVLHHLRFTTNLFRG